MSPSTNDWLAYAILLLQALVFVFFVLMLLVKAVEGFIRLLGGVHFDESTHPLDGGLFASIMDLDCLNGVRGGKAAARRRRKRGAQQLQRNVSAVGSLTTQMMLDRHSQGVARMPIQEGETPFLSPYPKSEETNYFPVYQPPLGPPPLERHSWESRSDEPSASTGHIMDAWRPPPTSISSSGYAAPGMSVPSASSPVTETIPGSSPQRSFSVVRGGRADYHHPYTVRDRPEVTPILSPPSNRVSQPATSKHARQQSASTLIEVVDGPGAPSQSNLSLGSRPAGLRVNSEGMRPPVLAIPKRRSLNNLKDEKETSPDSKYSDSSKSKKGKRRSKPTAWFTKATAASDESDDEPGPSRRKARRTSAKPAPFEPVPMSPRSPEDTKSIGWRSALGLGRKKSLDEMAEQARDENKARKAALATQSGALFAGVDVPTTPSPKKKAFGVNRKSGVPATVAPPPEFGGDQPAPPSFRVKRLAQLTPPPIAVPLAPPASSIAPSMTSPITAQFPAQSFKVIRPKLPSPTTGSFIVNRPLSFGNPTQTVASNSTIQTTNDPSVPIPDTKLGYPSSYFIPLSEDRRGSSEIYAPPRPIKGPRRASQERAW